MLTSVTTFAGLTPLLLEKSLQARSWCPWPPAWASACMFSTFITLILVPVSYTLLADIKERLGLGERLVEDEVS